MCDVTLNPRNIMHNN